MNKVIKTAKYYTTYESDIAHNLEFEFNTNTIGKSKRILDYLEANQSLFEIEEITTKKQVKRVYFTTVGNAVEQMKSFLTDDFNNNKKIIDHLILCDDLEFINKIETEHITI